MRERLKSSFSIIGAICIVGLVAASAPASAVIDASAEVILIRKTCVEGGVTLNNCFPDSGGTAIADATNWTWNTRNPQPSASNPLIWDIGPGLFAGQFTCPNRTPAAGYVTLRGRGRENSIIKATDEFTIVTSGCARLDFIDLRIESNTIAVDWQLGGDSSWSNVDLVRVGPPGLFYSNAWYEDSCGTTKAEHYFFGSRVIMSGNKVSPAAVGGHTAFLTVCSDIWFFGGEILMHANTQNSGVMPTAVAVGNLAEFHAFGSAIRTKLTAASPSTVALVGASTGGSGQFHMHGGIINVSVEPGGGATTAVYGTYSEGGGLIHTHGTAFNLKPSTSGAAWRNWTDMPGIIQSPFEWHASSFPPVATSETNRLQSSSDGQDTFIETDCNSAGSCNGAGNEPHPMIYAAARCGSANPWFDVVTRACRQ